MGFTGAKRRYADLIKKRKVSTESAEEIIDRITKQVNAFGGVENECV
jgi:hypothetical protein